MCALPSWPSVYHRSVAEASARTLQAMNPLVRVAAEQWSGSALLPPAAELAQRCGTLVLAASSLADIDAADAVAREAGVQLFAAMVRGPNSFSFVDLGPAHSYTEKGSAKAGAGAGAGAEAKAAAGPKELAYAPFSSAMSVPLSSLGKRTHALYGVARGKPAPLRSRWRALLTGMPSPLL